MKNLRFITTFTTICILITLLCPFAMAKNDGADVQDATAPELSSRSVLVGDAATGRILYSQNAYTRSDPASLTKTMMLLLAAEAVEREDVKLDDMVTASADCYFDLDDKSSSTAHIYKGETMSLRDLLYCAALASANEACNIIAEYIAGTAKDFVAMMNSRAEELGLTGTHFANTHGMPDDNHYTTAKDLFVIQCEGMKHELFRTLVGTEKYTTDSTNTNDPRELKNTNALINPDSVYGSDYEYEGAMGIKTGHTEAAGFCLAAAAEKNGLNLISIVLGADGDMAGGEYFNNFDDTVKILDWAFDNFSYRDILDTETAVAQQTVVKDGVEGTLNLRASEKLSALVKNDEKLENLDLKISLYEDTVNFPVEEGREVGTMEVSDQNGMVYGEVKLLAFGEPVFPEPVDEGIQGMDQMIARGIVAFLLVLTVVLLCVALKRRRRAKIKGGRR